MKIINVSVDIESQRLSSRSTSSQKNEHNEKRFQTAERNQNAAKKSPEDQRDTA